MAASVQQARLPEADTQAEGFDRTRSDHRSEIAEDYVELIADLIDATGEARAVDLANRLGVTNATVDQRDHPSAARRAWSAPSPTALSS